MDQTLTYQLAECKCCPRKCGVDRLKEKTGFCRIGGLIPVAHAGLHFGEEPPISGTNGSGTIFFNGCNLRCVFCQNHQISQEYRPDRTRLICIDELAAEMLRLQNLGAHNINFVSPSHMVLQMADAVRKAKQTGLVVPVVYNSSGYDSVDVLREVRGLVDIYLPDIKYLDNSLGKRYSAVDNYADIIPGVLREMLAQTGNLRTDDQGIAIRGLLVRHLVLPGHLENSRNCLRFLADLSPGIHVSIMSQYSPQYKAGAYPAIDRTLSAEEYDEITDFAQHLGLENAFIQELRSQQHYLPDFDQKKPFRSV